MNRFIVGRSYFPKQCLRHFPYWNSPFGYKVFEENGHLFTIDGDGDEREVIFLDFTAEVIITLENE